jgi:signal transduction histidine kinase
VNKRSIIFLGVIFILFSCNSDLPREASLQYKKGTNKNVFNNWISDGWITASNDYFNSGFSDTTWWLKTRYINSSGERKAVMLIMNNPHLNQIEVYRRSDTTPIYRLGDIYPVGQRPINDHDFVIPFQVAGKDTLDILLWVEKKGESMQMQIQWKDQEQYVLSRMQSSLLMGSILGWLLLIIVFCVILWMNIPDPTHIFYALYVLSITLWIVANWGLGFQFLWPNSPDFTQKARPLFLLLSMMFFTLMLLFYFKKPSKVGLVELLLRFNVLYFLVMILLLIGLRKETVSISVKTVFLLMNSVMAIFTLFLAMVQIVRNWKVHAAMTGYLFSGLLFLFISGFAMNIMQFGFIFPYQQAINMYGTSMSLLGETTIIAFGLAGRYNRYRREKELLSLELMNQQQSLSQQLIAVQEEERSKIGRDVHDSLGGLLSALKLYLGKFRKEHPGLALGKMDDLVSRSINEVRSITQDLVPPNLNEYGLDKAIRSHLELLRETTDIQIIYYFNIHTTLSIEVETIIYRISNELIGNAIKHAKGTEISLQLFEDGGKIQMIVEDNGQGFPLERDNKGFGLKNLQYRVAYLKGTVNIDSNVEGTTIIIEIPLNT